MPSFRHGSARAFKRPWAPDTRDGKGDHLHSRHAWFSIGIPPHQFAFRTLRARAAGYITTVGEFL